MKRLRLSRLILFFVGLNFFLNTTPALANNKPAPKVGRQAAAKYFQEEVPASDEAASRPASTLLMLHIGSYTSSQAYAWKGSDKREGVAKATYGVTYLYDTWHAFDLNFRADFSEFKLDEVGATKLSLLAILTFPMSTARFPLYFGLGAGPGVFFTQVENESNLSLDYQLIAGARFPDMFEGGGVFIETGLKNHLHLLSDGQLNGTALSIGAVFSF